MYSDNRHRLRPDTRHAHRTGRRSPPHRHTGPVLEAFKFAPGVEHRIFVGSFWIGIIFIGLVGMNL
jgi:hypothetical protein